MLTKYVYITQSKLSVGTCLEILILLSIFTVSFDEFLNIKIGFSFRFTQLCIICGLFLFALSKKNLILIKPLGFNFLFIWFCFIVVFIPNGFFIRNVGYAAWLFFNILTIILFTQYINTEKKLIWVYKIYIGSFVFVSAFGIFQFFAPLLGVNPPFVEQWWIYRLIPRVNGFSYEPSFYATYLLIGWVITSYFRYNYNQHSVVQILIPGLGWIHTVITLGIILSSSRMGFLMMGIWFLQYPVKFLISFYRLRIKKKLLKVNVVLVILTSVFVVLIASIDFSIILKLLQGTGLFGTSSHSAEGRFPVMLEVLKAFAKSPIIGYSLGGVANAIAELNGVYATDLAQLKSYEGVNVFAEVLAASGIIGFVPFVLYIVSLFYKPLKLAKTLNNELVKVIIISLVFALAFELLILQLNQNILRSYLWLHIALLSAAYRVSRGESHAVQSKSKQHQII